MKPAWDKLMAEYKGSKTVIVADVDCTAEGKPLCETHGVEGFPTIKHGDVSALESYEGGRDEASLSEFAKGLKPSCSPSNIDLCDDDKKKEIAALQKLSASELDAKIEEKDKESTEAEEHFQTELKKLQATYETLEKEKKEKIEAVKASGLGLMKAVKAASAKNTEEL